MKIKLLFLTLIFMPSKLFCSEIKNNSESFTVKGILIYKYDLEDGIYLIQTDNKELYRIENDDAKKLRYTKNLRFDTKYKFNLLKQNVASGAMIGIDVQIVSFEEVKEETSSCVIL